MAKKKAAGKKKAPMKKKAAQPAAKKSTAKPAKRAANKVQRKTVGKAVSPSRRDPFAVHEAMMFASHHSVPLPQSQAPRYYAVVEADGLGQLVRLVQDKMSEGWVAQGGAMTTPSGSYAQTVVKY